MCNRSLKISNLGIIHIVLLLIITLAVQCASKQLSTREPNVESIQGYFLQSIAQKLSEDFNKTNNEELGITFTQVCLHFLTM